MVVWIKYYRSASGSTYIATVAYTPASSMSTLKSSLKNLQYCLTAVNFGLLRLYLFNFGDGSCSTIRHTVVTKVYEPCC